MVNGIKFIVNDRSQNTVKSVLTATSEKRPPVNNGQSAALMASRKPTYHWSFSHNPLLNGHIFQVPRMAGVHRFDCTLLILVYVEVHLLIIISRLLESVCLHPKVIPLSGFHSLFILQSFFYLSCPLQWSINDTFQPGAHNSSARGPGFDSRPWQYIFFGLLECYAKIFYYYYYKNKLFVKEKNLYFQFASNHEKYFF